MTRSNAKTWCRAALLVVVLGGGVAQAATAAPLDAWRSAAGLEWLREGVERLLGWWNDPRPVHAMAVPDKEGPGWDPNGRPGEPAPEGPGWDPNGGLGPMVTP